MRAGCPQALTFLVWTFPCVWLQCPLPVNHWPTRRLNGSPLTWVLPRAAARPHLRCHPHSGGFLPTAPSQRTAAGWPQHLSCSWPHTVLELTGVRRSEGQTQESGAQVLGWSGPGPAACHGSGLMVRGRTGHLVRTGSHWNPRKEGGGGGSWPRPHSSQSLRGSQPISLVTHDPIPGSEGRVGMAPGAGSGQVAPRACPCPPAWEASPKGPPHVQGSSCHQPGAGGAREASGAWGRAESGPRRTL